MQFIYTGVNFMSVLNFFNKNSQRGNGDDSGKC